MKFLGLEKKEILQQQNSTKIKAYLQQLQAAPQFRKALGWGKLISLTGAAQIFIQAVGFLSGILIIRFLPLQEYAFYVIANTMLGTMSLLADGGISASMLSQGGEVWKDKNKLGAICATGLALRKKFAIGSLAVSLPILALLLIQNGASWIMVGVITVTLIPAFYAELSDALLDIIPKLHQRISEIQKNNGLVALGRLILTIFLISIFPFAFISLLANGIPRLYGNRQLKKIGLPFVTEQKPDKDVEKRILKTVTRIMPGAIYYCLSGQITIWILSLYGNTTGLAQLGALAKIAFVLSIISSLVSLLIIPRFARQDNCRKKLSQLYFQIVLGVFFILGIASTAIFFFPSRLLWILGDGYINLETELFITVLGSSVAILSGVAVLLNMSRDWIVNPGLSISISLFSIVLGVYIFDVETLQGVLLFNLFLAIVQLGIHFLYGIFRIQKIKPAITN